MLTMQSTNTILQTKCIPHRSTVRCYFVYYVDYNAKNEVLLLESFLLKNTTTSDLLSISNHTLLRTTLNEKY